jgi:TatD DNase family protein
MMIVDTHCHLDDGRYNDDIDQVIKRASKGGVGRLIIPGADLDTLERAVELAQKYEHIYFAVGIHPYDMQSYTQEIFDKYATHPKCVAIGECGLDYYRLEGSDEKKALEKRQQKEIFVAQIELAKKYKKPLIVHIRDASSDSKQILLENNAKEVGGVLHCYNANEQLLSLADENFYFGIGGVVTFKNAKKLVNVLPKIPLEKMLIETDGPYLAPTPHRGERNEPLYAMLVAQKISQLLDMPLQDVEEITTNNAKKLFNIL